MRALARQLPWAVSIVTVAVAWRAVDFGPPAPPGAWSWVLPAGAGALGAVAVALRRRPRRLVPLATLLLAGVILAGFAHDDLVRSFVVPYGQGQVVIGDERTADAEQWVQMNPEASPEDAVNVVAGNLELFWTRESIRGVQRRLWQTFGGLVVAVLGLLACGVGYATGRLDDSDAAPLVPCCVFISYRRVDTQAMIDRATDDLRSRFTAVFRDIGSVTPGHDWREHVASALTEAEVGVVAIGPAWLAELHARTSSGGDPDMVRLEIEVLLERGIPVIPLLVDGATLPAEAELPEPLRALRDRQGLVLRKDPDFASDIERLVEGIVAAHETARDRGGAPEA